VHRNPIQGIGILPVPSVCCVSVGVTQRNATQRNDHLFIDGMAFGHRVVLIYSFLPRDQRFAIQKREFAMVSSPLLYNSMYTVCVEYVLDSFVCFKC